jgi:hypothetical protein
MWGVMPDVGDVCLTRTVCLHPSVRDGVCGMCLEERGGGRAHRAEENAYCTQSGRPLHKLPSAPCPSGASWSCFAGGMSVCVGLSGEALCWCRAAVLQVVGDACACAALRGRVSKGCRRGGIRRCDQAMQFCTVEATCNTHAHGAVSSVCTLSCVCLPSCGARALCVHVRTGIPPRAGRHVCRVSLHAR